MQQDHFLDREFFFPYDSSSRQEEYCGHNLQIGFPPMAATDGQDRARVQGHFHLTDSSTFIIALF